MATVKFRLKGLEKKQNSIYVYISLGRTKFFETRTGFEIQPNNWNEKAGFPKQNSPANKNLNTDLKRLEAFLHDSINDANAKGELIDKYWLERKIRECFGRIKLTDREVLVNHIQHIIDTASTRKVKGKNGLGISDSRIKSYKTFLGIINDYEKKIRKTIRLTEINNQFVEGFTHWLLKTKNFSMNYAGKQLDNLKTVCRDAESLDVNVHNFAKNIQSFSESNENRFIVTLSFEEINRIRDTKMPSESLHNVKKWILIGCDLGQRGEDLLNISPRNHRIKNNTLYVDVVQQKTGKEVTIPIPSAYTKDVFLNQFPYKISLQKLNNYIKKVCEIAKIDEIIEGRKIIVDDKKIKRKVLGKYPKFELVTSHAFRRSFATNYYKLKGMSTPILMEITGHARENTFLQYINRQKDKDDNADMFVKYFEALELK